MVCTFSPPGVSSAAANSLRALARWRAPPRFAPVAAICLVECVVVERCPVRQRCEHAVRHVGGRRLGEGEAEDFRGIDAVEQQPDHTLRQHMGLARAGVGRHPCRCRRIGRLALLLDQLRGNDAVIRRSPHRRPARPSATIP